MAQVTGSQLVAEQLRREGVDTLFYIMGGPIIDVAGAAQAEGIRTIDVRHEQAAAMMAHAYARVSGKPGVCMACSGPGLTNLVTGVANAWWDRAPVIAFAGSSPRDEAGTGAFQEVDQVALMRPITRWAEQLPEAERAREYVRSAFYHATHAGTGPVFLDLPADLLYREARQSARPATEASADAADTTPRTADIARAAALVRSAKRPIVISGSAFLWSGGAEEARRLITQTGIPVYSTPQGRGLLPEDAEPSYPAARSHAFARADLVLLLGTRINYVVSQIAPPRFADDVQIVHIDPDPSVLGHPRAVEVALHGSLPKLLGALSDELADEALPDWTEWRAELALREHDRRERRRLETLSAPDRPVHPERLCLEVEALLDRDAVLVVDGQEILTYARQTILTHHLGHRLNSGPFGCMGVGVPFGIGAKLAAPETHVVVLTGDGALGMNVMELETAARHGISLTIIVSNNEGWSGDAAGTKPGRRLSPTRYDLLAEALGARGYHVDSATELAVCLSTALASDELALVNVKTDPHAEAQGTPFARYDT